MNTTACYISFAVSCAWLGAVCVLLWRSFQQSRLFPRIPSASWEGPYPAVTVIVPARNECDNISRSVESLMQQNYPAACLRVIVVDDQSSDGTGPIVERIAARHSNLTLLRSNGLPNGWTGKSHACWLASRQTADEAEWLCFVDADVWSEPRLIGSAVGYACRHNIDLLSLSPRHELHSFAERLLLPCGHYLLAFCQDLRKLQADQTADATVTGQFMLIRRSCYDGVNGHAAVAKMICEDLGLARLIKRTGASVKLCSGDRLLATRMYTGWSTLWPGIAKNLVEMLGGPPRTAVIAVAAIILSWASIAIPAFDIALVITGTPAGRIALVPALLGSTAIVAFHIAGARHFQIPIWYGLIYPFAYTVGAVMAFDSIWRRYTGRIAWKGRIYP